MNCDKCGKPLKAIGTARKNGKQHDDWDTRTLHKKCWLEEKKFEETKRYIKFYNLFKN